MSLRAVADDTAPVERLYTVPEAAKLLRCSTGTIRNLIKDRKLGYHDRSKDGAQRKRRLIPDSEIQRHLAATYNAPRRTA